MTRLEVRRPLVLVALATTLAMAFAALPQLSSANAAADDGSGGRAVAHRGGGARVASAEGNAPTAELSRINVAGAPINAVEPTLGLTKSGDIFYTAFQSNTRIEVAHSGDNGKTWDLRSPEIAGRNVHGLSVDPYIYVDKDTDRIFNIDLTVACSYMSFSDDKGKSWITNPLACGRPVNDHQTLFAGPTAISPTVGYENVVYYCWNDVGSSSCSKSLDGGLSFSPTGAPAFPGVDPDAGGQGSNFCGGLHAHGFVGDDGTLLLPKGHCGQPWLAISKDEGKTWTRVQVAKNGTADHEADAVMDKKGNIYYLWLGDDRLPYLATSTDGGKTWSKPTPVGPPGLKEANLPSIDAQGVGKIALVYYGSENSPYVQCDEGCPPMDYTKTTWNGYLTISDNALSQSPLFYTGLVNTRAEPLVRQKCGPGRCHNVMDFIDVRIGPDGIAYGAFVDTCMPAPEGEASCTEATPTNAGAFAGRSEGLVTKIVGGPSLN